MMPIIRRGHDKRNPFLQVSRELLQDTEIDLTAKGLLVYLLDKPDDWSVRPDQVARELMIGEATVYRLLDRLIEAGYVSRVVIRRRKPDGRFDAGSLYTVYEDRTHDDNPPF